jgi:hypothetical protein
VLLKNQGNLLPLAKTARIAAIGPWIKPGLQPSMNSQTNAYVHAYAGSSGVMVDFLDGLNAAVSSPITFVQGCESNQTSPDDPKGLFAATKQAAAAADVTVLAVGLTLNVRLSLQWKPLDSIVLRTAFSCRSGIAMASDTRQKWSTASPWSCHR